VSRVLDGNSSIEHVATIAGVPVQLADSVAFGSADNRGDIIVCGSHGGRSAGEYALQFGYGALVSSDAGLGLNDAGVAGLRELGDHGIPAVGVAHTSARIGDGRDVWNNGVVSYVNQPAAIAGVRRGQSVVTAVAAIAAHLTGKDR
jgi:hypothetical protein